MSDTPMTDAVIQRHGSRAKGAAYKELCAHAEFLERDGSSIAREAVSLHASEKKLREMLWEERDKFRDECRDLRAQLNRINEEARMDSGLMNFIGRCIYWPAALLGYFYECVRMGWHRPGRAEPKPPRW